jgi:hypothetical protein
MAYTQHRTAPWQEVMGADGEKIFAWGGQVYQKLSTSAPSANFTLVGTAVPAGWLYVIQVISGYNASRASTAEIFYFHIGVDNLFVASRAPGATTTPLVWNGGFVLKPGDTVRLDFTGATVGDVILAGYGGYKMVIP